jgi:peroxiredoxin
VRWLGELADHAAELGKRDVGVVAIAADSVGDMASLQRKLPAITLLSDLDLAATAAWGQREPGATNPSPGTFVVSRDGIVRWRRLDEPSGDWPTYAELVAALP